MTSLDAVGGMHASEILHVACTRCTTTEDDAHAHGVDPVPVHVVHTVVATSTTEGDIHCMCIRGGECVTCTSGYAPSVVVVQRVCHVH